MRVALAFAVLAILGATAAAAESWQDWNRMISRQCPSRHPNWICDSCWLDLTDAFERTLSSVIAKKLDAIAAGTGRCPADEIGLSCEMGRRLAAYERLRMLSRFTAFSCNAVKCEDVALCSRFPPAPPWPSAPPSQNSVG